MNKIKLIEENSDLSFCDVILHLKQKWELICKELAKKEYSKLQDEFYKIFESAKYLLDLEIKMSSNMVREGYYSVTFYQIANLNDITFDFKPDKIKKSIKAIAELIGSSDIYKRVIGRIGVEALYVYIYALDNISNPYYISFTTDCDEWDDTWNTYLTMETFKDKKNKNEWKKIVYQDLITIIIDYFKKTIVSSILHKKKFM